MRQRLGIAQTLVGEPEVLILDEPANGLDPEGIAWMRGLLRDFADRGGTVLLSSHLLHEVQATVDHLVVISQGAVVASGPLAELLASSSLLLRTPDPDGPGRRAPRRPASATSPARIGRSPSTYWTAGSPPSWSRASRWSGRCCSPSCASPTPAASSSSSSHSPPRRRTTRRRQQHEQHHDDAPRTYRRRIVAGGRPSPASRSVDCSGSSGARPPTPARPAGCWSPSRHRPSG